MSTLATEKSASGISAARPRELSAAGIAKGAFGGAIVAAILNVAVFGVAASIVGPLSGKFDPNAPATALPAFQVVVASIVPAIAATLFTMLLNTFTSKPSRILVFVAAGFTLLSMGGPMSIAEASGATKMALALMHVIAGAAITFGILRLGKR